MILAHTYMLTWVVTRATLADDDVACLDDLAAKLLDAEALAL